MGKLSPEETSSKATQLGIASALMIIFGYPGELVLDEEHIGTRWGYWAAAMVPFCFVVYTLIVGLATATESEQDANIRSKIKTAQWMTVISWCTYPIVYIIYGITNAKSKAIKAGKGVAPGGF